MTKVTVKSAEIAKAIVAAIMPSATEENSQNTVFGKKKQNRFFEDAASGNSYCLAYADDCETLKHINVFDDSNEIVAVIEIDSESGQTAESAVKAIGAELGMEINAANDSAVAEVEEDGASYDCETKVVTITESEIKATTAMTEFKKFEVGLWYYDLFDSKKRPAYKVTRRTKKTVTLIDEFGEITKHKIRIDLGVEEIHIGGYNSLDETELKANRFCTDADEIQETESQLAYSLGQDAAEVEEENEEKAVSENTAAEIIACLDVYFVNSDDAAMVEIENEINNRFAEDKKRQDFIKSVLNMGDLDGNKEIKLIRQDADGGEVLTARNVAFNGFDYRKMCDGLYHVRIIPQGHETFSTLASYESEEQALKVIQELGAAIQRGDETFSFAPVEGKKFEVGKIYSCGKHITHTPLKFLKVIERKNDAVFLEDITGRKFWQRVFFDKSYSNEVRRNAEQIFAPCASFVTPRNFCAVDEVSEPEWKFAVENLDAMYPPAEVTPERVLEFFADYIQRVSAKKNNPLKEKIAEIKNRPRKSVIDWDALYRDSAFAEIFALQDELKKSLELGEIERAENIFGAIKTAYKKTA